MFLNIGTITRLIIVGLSLLVVLTGVQAQAQAQMPGLRVLILSGMNNHDWRSTTPVIKKAFEGCARFCEVDVTDAPGQLDAATLAKYDVLVSNWTPYPDTARQWPAETEKAFFDFIQRGGGFVVLHAAACTFQVWPEFQQLIALTWEEKHTSHTRIHTFKVSVEDVNHPITQGMSDFFTTDELYQKMVQKFDQKLNVVCKAFAATEQSGTGQFEPMLVWTQVGKGRGVNLVLGHDAASMQTGFKTLLLRSAEWAATGAVTIPIPESWPTTAAMAAPRALRWEQTDTTVALMNSDKVVWQFNYAKTLPKPFFHPVSLLDGTELTVNSPKDHPWHHALWFCLHEFNDVNYWEEDRVTGATKGITEVTDVKFFPDKDFSARIEMALSYHPANQPPVLTENRTMRVSAPDSDGRYSIDWQATFIAGKDDVVVKGGTSGGGYGGLAVRVAQTTRNWRLIDSEGREDVGRPGMAKNTHGQHARWMDFSLEDIATGQPAGIAILEHPTSLRHPSQWHNLIDDKTQFGYFNPAPCWSEPYTVRAGKEMGVRYRVLVHPGRLSKDVIESEWQQFSK